MFREEHRTDQPALPFLQTSHRNVVSQSKKDRKFGRQKPLEENPGSVSSARRGQTCRRKPERRFVDERPFRGVLVTQHLRKRNHSSGVPGTGEQIITQFLKKFEFSC